MFLVDKHKNIKWYYDPPLTDKQWWKSEEYNKSKQARRKECRWGQTSLKNNNKDWHEENIKANNWKGTL